MTAATPPRRVLTLMHGHWYRVVTTTGKVFDQVVFDRERMVFRTRVVVACAANGGHSDRVRALPLDIIERVAEKGTYPTGRPRAAGGEIFVPLEDCYLEPVSARSVAR